MERNSNFELAMSEEARFRRLEYACVAQGDFAGADAAHKMRWRMMDKAVKFVEEAQE